MGGRSYSLWLDPSQESLRRFVDEAAKTFSDKGTVLKLEVGDGFSGIDPAVDPALFLKQFEMLSPSLIQNRFLQPGQSVGLCHLAASLDVDGARRLMTLFKSVYDIVLVCSEPSESVVAVEWLDHSESLHWIFSESSWSASLAQKTRDHLTSLKFPYAFMKWIGCGSVDAAVSFDGRFPVPDRYDGVFVRALRDWVDALWQAPPPQAQTRPSSTTQLVQSVKTHVQPELVQALTQLEKSEAVENKVAASEQLAKKTVEAFLAQKSELVATRQEREALYQRVMEDVLGLGPLEPLLRDPTVAEIMVNGSNHVFVERRGCIEEVPVDFQSEEQLRTIVDRIVAPIGRRVDESMPLCDARLPDGSRVNIVLPPLALNGPVITIRKFSKKALGFLDLVGFGSLSEEMAAYLTEAVQGRRNIVISGGTGSGKTTLLNALSGVIPDHERIVTIEDAAELQLQKPHVVRLESRPANAEGQGEISIRRLVINALRMRPDRIVVGECRGGEALDMLQAMNTGHDGSLTTLHANSPRDALGRLETLVLMSGMDLPVRVVREQIRSAVDMIVQQSRLSDGSRRITAVSLVTGMEGETLTLQDVFRFRDGRHEAVGVAHRASAGGRHAA